MRSSPVPGPQPGRPPPACDPRPPPRRTRPATAGATGCAPPHRPAGGRWRRRRAVVRRDRARRGGASASACRNGRAGANAAARRRSGGHGPARSGGQPMATLEPAVPQHGPTGTRGHPVPEPVALGAAPVVGLVGPLHDLPPGPRSLLARGGYGPWGRGWSPRPPVWARSDDRRLQPRDEPTRRGLTGRLEAGCRRRQPGPDAEGSDGC